jgi:hypothetical protein
MTAAPHGTDNTDNTDNTDEDEISAADRHHGFRFTMRLSDHDLKQLDRVAKKMKLNRTEAIRESIRAWARRIL